MKPLIAGAFVLLALLCAGCASPPSAVTAPPPSAAAHAGTAAVRPRATASPPAALARAARCRTYPAAVYGIDPKRIADTGGGAQLITVVDPTAGSTAGTFTAWARTGSGCWNPVSFPGQPAQPFRYPYHHLACGDWWDEQPGSPGYDTFRHVPCGVTPPYGGDSEALWTDIRAYQHFIDIEMPHPPDHGAGIFLHDNMPQGYTEGCIALPPAELDAVLAWLNPARAPHVLITVR